MASPFFPGGHPPFDWAQRILAPSCGSDVPRPLCHTRRSWTSCWSRIFSVTFFRVLIFFPSLRSFLRWFCIVVPSSCLDRGCVFSLCFVVPNFVRSIPLCLFFFLARPNPVTPFFFSSFIQDTHNRVRSMEFSPLFSRDLIPS